MADGLKSSMFSISEEVIKNCVVEEGVEETHAVQLFYNVLLFVVIVSLSLSFYCDLYRLIVITRVQVSYQAN